MFGAAGALGAASCGGTDGVEVFGGNGTSGSASASSSSSTGAAQGSSGAAGGACTPGDENTCECPDGGEGLSTCGDDGTWQPCAGCGSSAETTGAGGAGGGSGSTGSGSGSSGNGSGGGSGSSGNGSGGGSGVCEPGSTQACYSGPPGTEGVGICSAGQQTCNASGTAWGPCQGQVLPGDEDCATPADEDCDGEAPSCACPEPGEPKLETEGDALELGTITCFNQGGGQIHGVLSGADDVDWYVYSGNEVGGGGGNGCSVDPTVGISPEGPIRVCQFFHCPSGELDVDCPSGTTSATSPEGRPGCCAFEDFDVDLNCAGEADDDVVVWIRVDSPEPLACQPYTLQYHY